MRPRTTAAALALLLGLLGCGNPTTDVAAGTTTPEQVTATPSEGDVVTADKSEAGLELPAEGPTDAGDGDTADEPAGDATDEPAGLPTDDLPGGRYVQITDITAEGQGYAVVFEPVSFTPVIGTGADEYHVHFFFDTIAPENAGTNGPDPGEWFLYDGPSPFSGYTFADRPPAATRMCALVADSSHGVTIGSGNCVILP